MYGTNDNIFFQAEGVVWFLNKNCPKVIIENR